MALLKVEGISKRSERSEVLSSINFEQKEQEKLVVLGENGSGKTTLLKIIAGLLQPDEGAVYLESIKVQGPAEKLVPGHPQIAFLSQNFELQKHLRVEQILDYSNNVESDLLEEIISVCRIGHLLDRKTHQLSGGERQRIALARLLTTAPKLLLLDEPYTNLDIYNKNALKEVIAGVSDALKITCLMVSHDPAEFLGWANQLLVLQNGKIVQQGTPEEIYYNPVNTYTAGLLGEFNLIPARNVSTSSGYGAAIDNRFIVRPEQIDILDNGEFTGRITRVIFRGSYQEIHLEEKNFSCVSFSQEQKPFKAGETISFAVRAPNHRSNAKE